MHVLHVCAWCVNAYCDVKRCRAAVFALPLLIVSRVAECRELRLDERVVPAKAGIVESAHVGIANGCTESSRGHRSFQPLPPVPNGRVLAGNKDRAVKNQSIGRRKPHL